jgi:sporulation protein YlmC with PRC-barrel domain
MKETSMRSKLIHVCAALVAVGSLAGAQQEKKDPEKKPTTTTQQAPAGKSTEVMLHEIDHIQGVDVEDSAGKKIGSIDDVVLDTSDGSVDYAVISYGGVAGVGDSKRLVPWSSLKVTPKSPDDPHKLQAKTTLTEQQLEAAPAFEKETRLDAAFEKRVLEASGSKTAAEARASDTALVCAHDIEKADVKGSGDVNLCEIEKIMLDPAANYVGYVVFAHGGAAGIGEKHFAVPWDKLAMSYDKDNKLMVRAPTLTEDQVEKAPEYDAKDIGMCCRDYVTRVCEYYDSDPYWSRARP